MPKKVREWTLLEEVGRGGMGVVWRARHMILPGDWAVKVIRPELSSDAETRDRFLSEVTVLKRLRHPNVVEVDSPFQEGGELYLPMEFLAGQSLEKVLAARPGSWEPAAAVAIIRQAAAGIGFGHRQKPPVLHRDVKPGNIHILSDGRVKVVDFGLARTLGEKSTTSRGLAVGTPAYMAPEVLDGKRATPQSDVYGLGIVLYRLLAGRMPFNMPDEDSASAMAIVLAVSRAHASGLVDVRQYAPAVSSDLAGVVMSALAADPSERPADAAEFESRLARLYPSSVQSSPSVQSRPGMSVMAASPAAVDYDATSLGIQVSSGSSQEQGRAAWAFSAPSEQSGHSPSGRVERPMAGAGFVPGCPGVPDILAGIRIELPAPDDSPDVRRRGGSGSRAAAGMPGWVPSWMRGALSVVIGMPGRIYDRLPPGIAGLLTLRNLIIVGVAMVVVAGGIVGFTMYQSWKEARDEAARQAAVVVAPEPPSPDKIAGINWVRIEGGGFWMGSSTGQSDEQPTHFVTVKSFSMSATEVTIEQYQKCVDAGACSRPHFDDGTCRVYIDGVWSSRVLPQPFRGASNPVVCVDWEQASAFARWVGGRLPSEAEWEFAARAGVTADLYGSPGDIAWYRDNSYGSTSAVGRKRPNANGLYDMIGNVWEHCEDVYHNSYSGAPSDGSARRYPSGKFRVNRGSSWDDGASVLRLSNRYRLEYGKSSCSLGIRVVRDVI
ncbi:MAG TPA: bifunctional serine/threonine-protein kinase/formylglycine-generating enzyme family protein [Myxococcota bacterium]|nr:bifunctional serine/threonine-protein kinase/formylglycine-generating enzyme family protein [Myxococcota bacterium]